MNVSRIPLATYRLQYRAGVGFAQAEQTLAYLKRLGVSHLYESPVARARGDSSHGYDVVDPNLPDPALGPPDAFERLHDALRRHEMGALLDIVPNHMAATLENPWWLDVLRHGMNSPYARFFDIDWNPGPPELRHRVFLPLLDRPLKKAVADGKLRVEMEPDVSLRVGGQRLPLAHATVARIRRLVGAARGKPVTVTQHDLLEVLDEQHYLLGAWQEAPFRVNYRRFFDINDLVSLRVEDPAVFSDVHRAVAGWMRNDQLDGLRVDHVDGLLDPLEYARDLRRSVAGDQRYVIVEKILGAHEELRSTWPVQGTTGYEFGDRLNRLFVSADGLQPLDTLYRTWIGRDTRYADLLREQKRKIMLELFPGAFQRLAHDAARLLQRIGLGDAARAEAVFDALIAFTSGLRVYRTYVRDAPLHPDDRAELAHAHAAALQEGRASALLLRAIGNLFELRVPDERFLEALRLTQQWQQLSGPVMAKAHEDTALYLHHRLIALNDVGCDPDAPPLTVAQFHAFNASRAHRWPHTLNATTTHDTKRSEDVRARLLALSEVPDRWADTVKRWRAHNAPHRATVGGRTAPTPNQEYLYYQSVLGVWPLDPSAKGDLPARMRAFMVKAAREGKRQTSWIRPDDAYEQALSRFVDATLADREFLHGVEEFVAALGLAGALNSLSMLLLKATSPGVPDIYRGCEKWDFSLVDPDNRRPVDLAALDRELRRLGDDVDSRRTDAGRLLQSWRDGRVKLFTTSRALRLRGRLPTAFRGGAYQPVTVRGPRADQLVAFRRTGDGEDVLVVAPRGVARDACEGRLPLGDYWQDTILEVDASSAWGSAFEERTFEAQADGLRATQVLERFPLGLARRLR